LFTSDFKTTSCPVVIDFLIRHGIITPENGKHFFFIFDIDILQIIDLNWNFTFSESNFTQLVELLHVPLQTLYRYNVINNNLKTTNNLCNLMNNKKFENGQIKLLSNNIDNNIITTKNNDNNIIISNDDKK